MCSDDEEDQLRYLECSPNSDGLGEVRVRSGEEFELQCVLDPFKLVFRKFWIWANRVFVSAGVL